VGEANVNVHLGASCHLDLQTLDSSYHLHKCSSRHHSLLAVSQHTLSSVVQRRTLDHESRPSCGEEPPSSFVRYLSFLDIDWQEAFYQELDLAVLRRSD